jgi:hypothetical protein
VLFARAAVLNDAFQDQMEVICEHVRKMLKSQSPVKVLKGPILYTFVVNLQ